MRQAKIYRQDEFAGILTENNDGEYIFRYNDQYFQDAGKKPVSLTLPKSQQEYKSPILFPFFANMLSEGANRRLQCKSLKIDEADDFGLLLATASADTIGAITVKRIK